MKNIFFLFFFTLLQFSIMAQDKATLIYIGDPMCSWCYGFSPEFSKATETLKDKVDVQLVMGGLRPYNQETMSDLGDFLKEHWEHVNEASGQPFNYDILKETAMKYDTEPICRANVIARELNPDVAWKFFKLSQIAFYKDNKDPNTLTTMLGIAKECALPLDRFEKMFLSDKWKEKVKLDFQYSADLGVRGFPSVVLKKGEQYYLVMNGYAKSEAVVKAVGEALAR